MNALRKLAVIDCGTNTFNLRVVEMGAKGGWIPVFGQRIPVKLQHFSRPKRMGKQNSVRRQCMHAIVARLGGDSPDEPTCQIVHIRKPVAQIG